MSRESSVLADDIQYLSQFLHNDSHGDPWDLEVVTSRKRFDKKQSFPAWFPSKWVSADMVVRLDYQTVHLYSHTYPNPSEWLGRVLADFYKVEFQSTTQSNNPVTPKPS